MKIAVIFMLFFGFVQTFCENTKINPAVTTPSPSPSANLKTSPSPAANLTKEKTMNDSIPNNATQQICQLTLDLPALQQYYHADTPGRKPLNVIKNANLKDEVSLTKFGEPVKFISADEASKNKTAAIEFTSVKIADKTASVEFKYAVEGIKGKAEFKFTDKWEVVSSNISES